MVSLQRGVPLMFSAFPLMFYDVPMVFLWCSYGFPMVSLWFPIAKGYLKKTQTNFVTKVKFVEPRQTHTGEGSRMPLLRSARLTPNQASRGNIPICPRDPSFEFPENHQNRWQEISFG